jgi:hypothetical protein
MVKDRQVKGLFKFMSEGKPLYLSAQKADMCENTARKYVRDTRLPSEISSPHDWRTRNDPFEDVWPRIEEILQVSPHFEAKSAFDWLQREYPGRFSDGQLRTLQRRFRQWRGLYGKAREVFFPQQHHPGELGASDFTDMSQCGITLSGQPFDHLIFHYVLTWSNWEDGTVCFSESFESLNTGLQNAWWRCGGVPRTHRTDRLSAAVNNLDEQRDFTARYNALMNHYRVAGQKTNPSSPHENGDSEQRHNRLKRAVEQALILRGSRDFSSRSDYERFLCKMFSTLNKGKQERFVEERRCLKALPSVRLPDYSQLNKVLVSKGSTILVRKKVYSVHSRLRDEHVTVRLFAEHLEIYLGSVFVERLARIRGSDDHHINYRHVIDWLVRKPGAFANYKYKSDLFPTSNFRIAYDMLRSHCCLKADKEYLKILYCAASESEELVNDALRQLIDEQTLPCSSSVSALVKWLRANGVRAVTDAHIEPVSPSHYDVLLSWKEEES